MTAESRDWFPRDAVHHDVVRESFDKAVARWSERWFTLAYASVAFIKFAASDARNELDEAGWRIPRASVAMRAGRPAMARMVDRALDRDGSLPQPTGGDRYILAGLERRMLQDLAEEIEQALGLAGDMLAEPRRIADPLGGGDGLLVTLVETSGREIAVLAVPIAVVWRRLKTHLGPPRTRRDALTPLVEPLTSVAVAIEARVGGVELTLAELSDLAVGDVLILDQPLNAPVDVAGAGSGQAFAKARLTPMDKDMALVFGA